MECGYARLTVWFADPFWVGVYEREAEGRLEVCRHTFGAEPKDGEVWQWLLSAWHRPEKTGAGTKSQQALQLQREARRVERAQRHRQRDAAEEERRFRLRQEKKKEKRRGH